MDAQTSHRTTMVSTRTTSDMTAVSYPDMAYMQPRSPPAPPPFVHHSYLTPASSRSSADSSPTSSQTDLLRQEKATAAAAPVGQHARQGASMDTSGGVILPGKKGSRPLRYARWNFGSVYRRIFSLAFITNMVVIVVLAGRYATGHAGGGVGFHQTAGTAVAANIVAAVAVRNEHFVNALFLVLGSWPQGAPLRLRRLLAKVYSYGGIHSGCAVASLFWYVAFLADFSANYRPAGLSGTFRIAVIEMGIAVLILLTVMLLFAHPTMRARHHDSFEWTHRFLGWSLVAVYWAQILVLAGAEASVEDIPLGKALVKTPSFWMIIVVTLLIAYPWMHLRLREVEAEVLSSHCVKLNFTHAKVHYGQAVRLTDRPLWETHAFAVIPFAAEKAGTGGAEEDGRQSLSHAGERGFSVLVSNAGDWTSKTIRNPPRKMYTRGLPQYGVLRVAGLFSPVVIVATGSGIGPCMSLFVEKPDHPVRIVWSTKRPEQTYGRAVMDTVYKTDPDAVVIDTDKVGRPDLVRIVYSVYERGMVVGRHGGPRRPCEAVVMISNQKVTKKVIYGLESRGVPAYGAIFDS